MERHLKYFKSNFILKNLNCFFGAQSSKQQLKFVPVLRCILSLRFRDAASPGAKHLSHARKYTTPTYFFCKHSFIIPCTALRSINLIEAVILFAVPTQTSPTNHHKKIIAERRIARTEKHLTCFTKDLNCFFGAKGQ